jgi:integrase
MAQKAARTIQEKVLSGIDEGPRVDDLIAQFLSSVALKGRSEQTLGYYTTKGRQLVERLGDYPISALTVAAAENYLRARVEDGVSHNTVGKEFGLLRSALKYAKKLGQPVPDPETLIPESLSASYKPKDRFLSHSEYDHLYSKLSLDRRDYLLAYCRTGARESELYRITKRCISFGERKPMLRIPGTKTTGSDRYIPLDESVLAVLVRRAATLDDDDPIFPKWGNIRRDLKAACKRAEVASVSANDLRRTFCSWLAEQGVHETVTASLLGHSSSAMVRRVYARIGRQTQFDAIAKLPDLLGHKHIEVGPGQNQNTVTVCVTDDCLSLPTHL